MQIIEAISDLEKIKKGCVLTIGNFDGVHIGHQKILTAAKKTAMKEQTELVVMTFAPHPVALLRPQKTSGVLTPITLKKQLLNEFSVDLLFILKTNPELLGLSPQDFVDRFLVEGIQPNVVVEGQDFNFGYHRGGNIDTLQQLGAEKGFEVCVIEAENTKLSTGETVRVSSTMIRNLLESGSVADAAVALSRPYRLIGRVVPGHGRGKQLGFPTANLQPLQQIIPAEGVYAGFVRTGDSEKDVCPLKERIPAAVSVGRARTLGPDNPLAVEAHILTDDLGNLHDKWLAMDFVKHLRDQKKFETKSELAAQIKKDCKKAKNILAAEEH
jgi:riboflavin kinase/FMN adenylyltransferase